MAAFPPTIHLLVPSRDGGLLLTRSGALPTIAPAIEPGERLVAALQREVREGWDLDPVVLETHLPPPGHGQPYECLAVLEPPPAGWRPPGGWRWGSAPRDVPGRLAPRAHTWIAEWADEAAPPELRPRWSRIGWQARAVAWIDERLTDLGRPRTAPVTVVRLWSLSAMLRAPTADGPAWFKAVFPHFQHEAVLTPMLAARMPELVPAVLAADAAEGWLLLDDAGTPPGDDANGDDVVVGAISQLATAQRQLMPDRSELERAGCPRRPLQALARQLEEALAEWSELGGDRIDDQHAAATVRWVRDRSSLLDRSGWSETLVHGDFHPGNLLTGPEGTRIIDWSDAAMANPVVEMAAWMGEVRPELRPRGWDAWLTAMAAFGPAHELRDAEQAVYAIGCAYQVVSYAGILRGVEPANRYQLSDGLNGYWKDLVSAIASRR